MQLHISRRYATVFNSKNALYEMQTGGNDSKIVTARRQIFAAMKRKLQLPGNLGLIELLVLVQVVLI